MPRPPLSGSSDSWDEIREGLVDRRRVVVRPTARGAQAAREIFEPLIAESSELYAGYSDGEVALLIAFIRRSEALLSEHARRARSAGTASPPA